jgi:hypothetical protein
MCNYLAASKDIPLNIEIIKKLIRRYSTRNDIFTIMIGGLLEWLGYYLL